MELGGQNVIDSVFAIESSSLALTKAKTSSQLNEPIAIVKKRRRRRRTSLGQLLADSSEGKACKLLSLAWRSLTDDF